jgi:hypothetical protein
MSCVDLGRNCSDQSRRFVFYQETFLYTFHKLFETSYRLDSPAAIPTLKLPIRDERNQSETKGILKNYRSALNEFVGDCAFARARQTNQDKHTIRHDDLICYQEKKENKRKKGN